MKVYNFNDAYPKALNYFGGDALAAKVFLDKYALKNKEDELLECTPFDMHKRLASEFARIEQTYTNSVGNDEIQDAFDKFKRLVPQGGIMSGVGDNFRLQSLSNCFVIDSPSDSYGGIMRAEAEQIALMKRRGGVGHDLSNIRSKGAHVSNAARTSTGMRSFMDRFSNGTREVAQDGRRGALMLSCSIDHEEIDMFIDSKTDGTSITGANISVRVHDEFMGDVIDRPIIDPESEIRVSRNEKLWDKIVKNAHAHAEPGLLFWDTITRESPADCYSELGFGTTSTNPCGEIPLCPYDSCRLLAINLTAYVIDPWTSDARFDFDKFKADVALAQRLMDDMIDLELEKIDRILTKIYADPEDEEDKTIERNLWKKVRAMAENGRRTGLGITAEGDMIAMMGLTYGTSDATNFAVSVQRQLAMTSLVTSIQLAKERGCFPIWNKDLENANPYLVRVFAALKVELSEKEFQAIVDDYLLTGRRNIATLTIAPTGTTSLMTQTTSGIEPVFLPMYFRSKKRTNEPESEVTHTDEVGDQWIEFPVFHHGFLDWYAAAEMGNNATRRDAEESIALFKFTKDELAELVARSPYNNATSNDVDWKEKVRMQGAMQKWVDHSISVTVNLPENTPVETVDTLYKEAWKCGCKGLTVYRDGSRTGVLNADSKVTKAPLKTRPEYLEAQVLQFQNDKEKWVAIVGVHEGNPYEIFTGKVDSDDGLALPRGVKAGKIRKVKLDDGTNRYDFEFSNKKGFKTTVEGLSYKFSSEYWNYAKMLSGFLISGVPVHEVCEVVAGLDLDDLINSWKSGVHRSLKGFIKDGTVSEGKKCDDCGSDTLIYQEGCLICQTCGNSKCG